MLVLAVDFFNAGPADLVVVLPLTSTQRDIPLHVKVLKGDGGTRNDSTILCEAIRSVSKDRLVSSTHRWTVTSTTNAPTGRAFHTAARWGVLSQEVMAEVEARSRILLDL